MVNAKQKERRNNEAMSLRRRYILRSQRIFIFNRSKNRCPKK
jgi:hypothetical protein